MAMAYRAQTYLLSSVAVSLSVRMLSGCFFRNPNPNLNPNLNPKTLTLNFNILIVKP